MVALIRPKDWSQQPQGPVELDWSNPITPDFVFSGGSGGVLLGRKRYLVTGRGASDVFQASKYGLGYKPTRVTNSGLDFGAVQPITSDSWTVLTLANPTNAAVSTLFSQRNGSAPYNQIDIVANSNDSLAYRAGRFSGIAVGTPSGARAAVSSSATLVDGVFHVFGASRTGVTSVVELHYDGVNVSSTQNGTGTSTLISAAQKTRIGNIGDYTADAAHTAECNIPLVFIYNRTLTAAEIAKVSADMLLGVHFWAKRPPSRLFIPAAASGVFTLDAQPGSVTITGSAAGLKASRILSASPGAISITGAAATLKIARSINAQAGAVSITGASATFGTSRKLNAQPGAVTIAGADAGLVYTAIGGAAVLSADSGAVVITGAAATLKASRVLSADAGSITITGSVAGLVRGYQINAQPAAVAIAGADVGLHRQYKLLASPAAVTIAGADAGMVYTGASGPTVRAPSGSGPAIISPTGYRPTQSASSRPNNTGGRRY